MRHGLNLPSSEVMQSGFNTLNKNRADGYGCVLLAESRKFTNNQITTDTDTYIIATKISTGCKTYLIISVCGWWYFAQVCNCWTPLHILSMADDLISVNLTVFRWAHHIGDIPSCLMLPSGSNVSYMEVEMCACDQCRWREFVRYINPFRKYYCLLQF